MSGISISDIRRDYARKQQRRRQVRRWLWLGGTGLVLAVALFVFLLPVILRSQIQKRATEALGQRVTLESASFNPFNAALTLRALRVENKDTSELLALAEVHLNFAPTSLLFGQFGFDEVTLKGLSGHVIVYKDRSSNLKDIISRLSDPASPQGAAAPKSGRTLYVGHLFVEGARLDFEDYSADGNFKTRIGPLTFQLDDFEAAPGKGGVHGFHAAAETGEKLSWTGTLGVGPLRSAGSLDITDIPLAKYAPYYRQHLRADLASGSASLSLGYDVSVTPQGIGYRLSKGSLRVSQVSLVDRSEARRPLLGFEELLLSGIEADSSIRTASVADISLKSPFANLVRGTDASLNLASLLVPDASSGSDAPDTAESRAWLANSFITRLRCDSARLGFRDESLPVPLSTSLDELSLESDTIRLDGRSLIPLRLKGRVAGVGQLSVDSQLKISDRRLDSSWELSAFPLTLAAPYIEQHIAARLSQGTLAGTGHAALVLDPSRGPLLKAESNLTLRKLSLIDPQDGGSLATLNSLVLSGVSVDLADQRRVQILEVLVDAAQVSLVRDAEGRLNVQRLLLPKASTSLPSGEPVQALDLLIGRLGLTACGLSFQDLGARPGVSLSLRDFGGDLLSLGTNRGTLARVTLAGDIDGTGRLSISGAINPFDHLAQSQLNLSLSGLSLLPFSPYSGRFAGYTIGGGRLSLDVQAQVTNQRLQSNNVLTLDRFSFGDAVSSPDATGLPVRFAVSLLKDRNGQIIVDLPVNGDLNDPEFRVRKVVWRIVENILTKSATSPFALLGSLVGGGDELSQLSFAAGDSALDAEALRRLGLLAKAMAERPGLSLDVLGGSDDEADYDALQRAKLEQRVRLRVWEARRAIDLSTAAPEALLIEPVEREQVLRRMYAESVAALQPAAGVSTPVNQMASTPEPQKPSAQVPARRDVPQGSLLQRIVSAFTGKRPDTVRRVGGPTQRQVSPQGRSSTPLVQTPPAATPPPRFLPLPRIEEELLSQIEVTADELIRLSLDRARVVEAQLSALGVAKSRLFLSDGSALQKAEVHLSLK